jgi:hypothetical protein
MYSKETKITKQQTFWLGNLCKSTPCLMHCNRNSIVTFTLHCCKPDYDEPKGSERQTKNIIPFSQSMIIMWEDGQANLTRTDLESNPEYCVRSQASPCGICGGQSSTGNEFFFLSNSISSFQCHSITFHTRTSFIHHLHCDLTKIYPR